MRLERVSRKYGLLINVEKTKVMTTGGSSCSIDINNMLVEVVSSFPYLGSLITDDAVCTKDIRGRWAKGLGIGANLKKIWQNHGICISTKIRLMKALVWPVAMYGCESWTLKKDDENRISAFEMKCLRPSVKKSTCICERNETGILWAYIEKARGLPGEGINTRYNPRLPYSR